MNKHSGFLREIIFCCLIGFHLIPSVCIAKSTLTDFGLPLFGFVELRLEKEKSPEFNMQLLKKFLSENNDRMFHHLHAINALIGLMKLSEEGKSKELKRFATEFFANQVKISSDSRQTLLDEIYFSGLLLADDKGPDEGKNKSFEELLLKAEDALPGIPEYDLVKGILFPLLRDRPMGYFAPMRPFEDLRRAAVSAPPSSHFHFVLGQAFRALGSQESNLYHAIVAYEKSSSLNPANERLQNTLLGLYMGFHESYQSEGKKEPFWLEETVYKKILVLSPNNPCA
ncbi:hypothetical protein HYY75_05410, partial [bacterium]|nr:hypothetical protein [bacterium]